MANSRSNAGASVTNQGHVDIGAAVRRSRQAVGYSVEDLARPADSPAQKSQRLN